MTALLTDNLPLLAGAPNGIKKLRELILELAVRGKLVPQDPSDEPASELLKRIAVEKARLVAEGKIKKLKALAEIGEEEKPFDVPTSWKWTRLGELGLVGSSSRVHQKDWQTSGVPFYRAREIVRLSKDGFVDNELFISEELYQELSTGESVPKAGDIMLTGVGTIGVPYCVQKTDRFYFKDASVLIFKNHVADNSSYLLRYFISPLWVDTIHAESMGTTVHTLTIARANETLCPLPPLAEQHRIVAKVDELMALCDRLDAQQADAECAHAQLVQALLDSLAQARDAEDFAQSWQRLAEHFHTLFTTESSIDALKQTLLQLAVMGKLVPQDPSDEPASELLKRIAEEKARLVAEGKIKKQTQLSAIAEEEKPHELPVSWDWVRLPEIYYPVSVSGNKLLSSQISEEGVFPVIDQGKRFVAGYTDDESLLIRLPGPVVVFGDHTTERKYVDFDFVAGADGVKILRPILLDEKFFWWHLVGLKLEGRGYARHFKVLNDALFALPPKGEQSRIVAKVDHLMTLCDQLKARLNQARQVHEQLANALVEQAVA